MIMTRKNAIAAAVAAAAALTATGITYATAAPAPQAAQAAPAAPAAPAVVQQAPAPAQAPMGGDTGNNNNDRGDNDHGDNDHGNKGNDHDYDRGWIHINERSYSAHPGGCVVVVSGLGSRSLNIRNDSRKTVEVFRGATCDNGAPIATVGPHSSSDGVHPGRTKGVKVKDGVVGSFRVIDRHHGGGDKGDY